MNAAAFPSQHLYTLTGNLLAERTLEFDHWSPGRTQRAKRQTFQVGGKGINVAKMLTRLAARRRGFAHRLRGRPAGLRAAPGLHRRKVADRCGRLRPPLHRRQHRPSGNRPL